MRGEQGFTLIEVLVALVVASLLLAVLMNGALEARLREQRVAEQQQAFDIAREQLDRALIDGLRPADGQQRGRAGQGYVWTVSAAEIARDPRALYLLAEYRVEAGPTDRPALVALRRCKLLSLVARP